MLNPGVIALTFTIVHYVPVTNHKMHNFILLADTIQYEWEKNKNTNPYSCISFIFRRCRQLL